MHGSTTRRAVAVLTLAGALIAGSATSALAGESTSRPGWAAGWSTSVQQAVPPEIFGPNWSEDGFSRQSVRQVVRVTTGGPSLRIRVSNVYGSTPLRLTGATIGKAAGGAAVRPATVRPVTFGRSSSTTVQPGRDLMSDVVLLPTSPLDELAVTFYFADPTGPATFHVTSFATSYRAAGDHRFDARASAFTESTESWYYLAGVEVNGQRQRGTVVAFGDSITDGFGATVDAGNRYPDELAERLVAAHRPTAVANAGLSGNKVLSDLPCCGERATARFQRDVASLPGVRTVIVLEGINDIGASTFDPTAPVVTLPQLIGGHRELIAAAHARGIKAIGATLTPIKGSFYDTPANEALRDGLNDWIRTSGAYDAVVDFDRATGAPGDPDRLNPAYDSGDALHPNDTGYHAMAAAVDLNSL
jgi:lysophospholipase L1-like esterase